ncbi:MAG: hypothetical protein WD230_09370, partial [Cucumibacter sp.]
EILYVVETDCGYIRLLEQSVSASQPIGAKVHVDFAPTDSLVFDSSTEVLITGAQMHPRILPGSN